MTILIVFLFLVAMAALAPRFGTDSRELSRSELRRDDLWMRHEQR